MYVKKSNLLWTGPWFPFFSLVTLYDMNSAKWNEIETELMMFHSASSSGLD